MNKWSKISLILGCIISVSFMLSSCDETDDAKDAVKEKTIGLMSATIDGEEWEADAPFGKTQGELTIITGVGLIGGNDKGIILTLKGNTTGTYGINYNPLDSTENSLNAATYSLNGVNVSDPATTYNAFNGEIVISEIDGARMTGTFNFSCANFAAGSNVDTVYIENGEFSNINYQD